MIQAFHITIVSKCTPKWSEQQKTYPYYTQTEIIQEHNKQYHRLKGLIERLQPLAHYEAPYVYSRCLWCQLLQSLSYRIGDPFQADNGIPPCLVTGWDILMEFRYLLIPQQQCSGQSYLPWGSYFLQVTGYFLQVTGYFLLLLATKTIQLQLDTYYP